MLVVIEKLTDIILPLRLVKWVVRNTCPKNDSIAIFCKDSIVIV
jgi:hypothetical protein